jgi:hypothetical protein
MPARSKIERKMKLVVVLPFVPVIPTVVIDLAGSPKNSHAASAIAERPIPGATTSWGSEPTSGPRECSHMNADAPARAAWTAKSCPSWCSPTMQQKSAPGRTSR